MQTYKIPPKHLLLLKRWYNSLGVMKDSAEALQAVITKFLHGTLVPSLGIKTPKGTKIKIDIDIEKGVAEVGLAQPDKKIFVP